MLFCNILVISQSNYIQHRCGTDLQEIKIPRWATLIIILFNVYCVCSSSDKSRYLALEISFAEMGWVRFTNSIIKNDVTMKFFISWFTWYWHSDHNGTMRWWQRVRNTVLDLKVHLYAYCDCGVGCWKDFKTKESPISHGNSEGQF